MSRYSFACAALVASLLAPARAGGPSAGELIALAPVLDSSDQGFRSLDVAGYIGGEKGPGPRLRFRAHYRAPDRFSLLISDAADGTPLALRSGGKMFVYDPLGPTVYNSENASCTLEMAVTKELFKFNYTCLMKGSRPHHVLIDFRSVLSGPSVEGRAAVGGASRDSVVQCNTSKFQLIGDFRSGRGGRRTWGPTSRRRPG